MVRNLGGFVIYHQYNTYGKPVSIAFLNNLLYNNNTSTRGDGCNGRRNLGSIGTCVVCPGNRRHVLVAQHREAAVALAVPVVVRPAMGTRLGIWRTTLVADNAWPRAAHQGKPTMTPAR
jgi:hypothetical protein